MKIWYTFCKAAWESFKKNFESETTINFEKIILFKDERHSSSQIPQNIWP